MEDIKRKLVESGVIGQVVDDFNPLMELTAFYRYKRISLGDEVTRAEVEHAPTELEYYTDTVEFVETFQNRELVTLVMTDLDAAGGEYLDWVIQFFIDDDKEEFFIWEELLAYEPPRPGAHKIVLTLYKVQWFFVFVPNSRDNFSNRAFAEDNDLGPTVGASVFNIKHENEENQKRKADPQSTSKKPKSTSKKPKVHKSTKSLKKFKKLADLY